ncbi:hypothetical protein OSB04_011646 [Centaurea solstitialis]|uniref:Uncharacterized protein n=1 Tax=Centaurea solstitialis TaxID=347529 RepID=A0AA38WD54_9ASTR|nr:hypothetical protein OSB04_011646 [Centaurea solstitialis]
MFGIGSLDGNPDLFFRCACFCNPWFPTVPTKERAKERFLMMQFASIQSERTLEEKLSNPIGRNEEAEGN